MNRSPLPAGSKELYKLTAPIPTIPMKQPPPVDAPESDDEEVVPVNKKRSADEANLGGPLAKKSRASEVGLVEVIMLEEDDDTIDLT